MVSLAKEHRAPIRFVPYFSRLQESESLLLLPVLTLLVHLLDLLCCEFPVASLLLETASIVRVGGGVDIEEGIHLATGSAGGIVAVGGLLSRLIPAGMRVKLSHGVVVLIGGLLSGGCCCLWVLFYRLLVCKPVVVGGIRSILVVAAVNAGIVALPSVQWVLVVVRQRPSLIVADGLLLLDCLVSVQCCINGEWDHVRVSFGVGCCRPEMW